MPISTMKTQTTQQSNTVVVFRIFLGSGQRVYTVGWCVWWLWIRNFATVDHATQQQRLRTKDAAIGTNNAATDITNTTIVSSSLQLL
jgi:hypothetical protein